MAINVARLPDVAAAKIALPADGEINFCHLAFLREQLVKEAGGGRIFFGEEGLDVALQVDNEVFAFVTFELRGNAFFVTHNESSFLSSMRRLEMGWKLSLVAAGPLQTHPMSGLLNMFACQQLPCTLSARQSRLWWLFQVQQQGRAWNGGVSQALSGIDEEFKHCALSLLQLRAVIDDAGNADDYCPARPLAHHAHHRHRRTGRRLPRYRR